MESRITVECDFNNHNEIIQQIRTPVDDTDDSRDKQLKHFLQSLGGTSSWLKVEYQDRHRDGEARVFLRAITPNQLQVEGTAMLEQANLNRKFDKKK